MMRSQSSQTLLVAFLATCFLSSAVCTNGFKLNFQLYGDAYSFQYFPNLAATVQSTDFWQMADISFYPATQYDGKFSCDASDWICQGNKLISCGEEHLTDSASQSALFAVCYMTSMAQIIETGEKRDTTAAVQNCQKSRAFSFTTEQINAVLKCAKSTEADSLINYNVDQFKALNNKNPSYPLLYVQGTQTPYNANMMLVACQQYEKASEIESCQYFLPQTPKTVSKQ